MIQPQRFQIGDRVRVTQAIEAIPIATLGTIVRSFLAPDYYEVWFDGASGPRVVRAAALELVKDAPAAG